MHSNAKLARNYGCRSLRGLIAFMNPHLGLAPQALCCRPLCRLEGQRLRLYSDITSRRLAALILLLMLLVVARSQQSGAATLTVDDAISIALPDNRQLKNAKLAIGKADDQLAATRTLRLPSFNLYVLGSQQLAALNFTFAPGTFGTFPGIG